jgi:hypothetical protein
VICFKDLLSREVQYVYFFRLTFQNLQLTTRLQNKRVFVFVRLEVLTELIVTFSWDVTPYSLIEVY